MEYVTHNIHSIREDAGPWTVVVRVEARDSDGRMLFFYGNGVTEEAAISEALSWGKKSK